ncbi:MAG: stressosome-associated protein Prli42 [Bacillus sp. (in: firmicutes)]
MKSKKIQKIFVYIMIALMLSSTILSGIAFLL